MGESRGGLRIQDTKIGSAKTYQWGGKKGRYRKVLGGERGIGDGWRGKNRCQFCRDEKKGTIESRGKRDT